MKFNQTMKFKKFMMMLTTIAALSTFTSIAKSENGGCNNPYYATHQQTVKSAKCRIQKLDENKINFCDFSNTANGRLSKQQIEKAMKIVDQCDKEAGMPTFNGEDGDGTLDSTGKYDCILQKPAEAKKARNQKSPEAIKHAKECRGK